MRRAKFSIPFVAGCCLSILFMACGAHSYLATATCGETEALESDLGLINVELQLSLGTYFFVNSESNPPFARRLGILNFGDENITTGKLTDTLSTNFNSSFTVTFEGELGEKLKTDLTNRINKNTQFKILRLQRVSLNDVDELLNANPNFKSRIKEYLQYPKTRVFFVNSVNNGDKLSIGLNNGKQIDTNVTLAKYGKISLKVTYVCDDSLTAVGHNIPMFIKLAPIAYDQSTDKLYVDVSAPIPNLRKIDKTNFQ